MNQRQPLERLQKLLARAGLGSRREIERWIEAGEITVNGRLATLGDQATPADRICRGGCQIKLQALSTDLARVLVYYKPEGEICSRHDPKGRPSVFQALPQGRWISVGRLDINSQGLLLFTNDGELAHRLMHPGSVIEREYAVRIRGFLEATQRQHLLAGLELEDGMARFTSVVDAGGGEGQNHWYHVVIKEGRKREIRRLFEAVGLLVSRLIRVRYGPLRLPRSLRSGRWYELNTSAMSSLYAAAGLCVPPDPIPIQKGSGRHSSRTGRHRR